PTPAPLARTREMTPPPPVRAREATPTPPPAMVSSAVDQKLAAISAKGPEYEAIAKLSREIIEQIVWEVVPELAEAIIRERLDRDAGQIGLDARFEAHGAGDDVAEARLLGLFGRDEPGAHLLLNPGVILGQLAGATVPVEVGARVTDVAEVDVAVGEEQGGQR